jgi:hypothetical protein
MIEEASESAEKVFDKLPDLGYSDKTAYLIWLWYHPTEKCSTDVLDQKMS